MALFKLPSHYVFDYKPIYYDPRKERREAVRQQVRKELGKETDPNAYRYTIRFRSQAYYHKRIKRGQNVRLLVILVLLFGITYLILYSDVLQSLIEKILK